MSLIYFVLQQADEVPEGVILLWKIAKGIGALFLVAGPIIALWKAVKSLASQNKAYLEALIKEQAANNEKQNKGLQTLLRYRLQRLCDNVNRKGHRNNFETEYIISIHDAYKNLGHNGVIDETYNRALAKPCDDE